MRRLEIGGLTVLQVSQYLSMIISPALQVVHLDNERCRICGEARPVFSARKLGQQRGDETAGAGPPLTVCARGGELIRPPGGGSGVGSRALSHPQPDEIAVTVKK